MKLSTRELNILTVGLMVVDAMPMTVRRQHSLLTQYGTEDAPMTVELDGLLKKMFHLKLEEAAQNQVRELTAEDDAVWKNRMSSLEYLKCLSNSEVGIIHHFLTRLADDFQALKTKRQVVALLSELLSRSGNV